MRAIILTSLALAMTAGAATAAGAPKSAPAALSAERYGVKADYRGPILQVGYSWKARRAASCLATYPGAYDPKTDRVRVKAGVIRRCEL